MRALLDLPSELAQLAPSDYTVPFGVIDVLAAFFVLVRRLLISLL